MARFESTRKPQKCPSCGSKRIATIMYGKPFFTKELENKLSAGEIVLGGCCISDDDPQWECADCRTPIHKTRSEKIGN